MRQLPVHTDTLVSAWCFVFALIVVMTNWWRVGIVIEAPQGGVPPPNVFGVWSVAIREVVRRNKALRFEFSGRRSYGFCSRLCPRQVLGFSALSSAGSWNFSTKLAEDLSKKNEN